MGDFKCARVRPKTALNDRRQPPGLQSAGAILVPPALSNAEFMEILASWPQHNDPTALW